MLVARLLLGTIFIVGLVGLCWLDYGAPRPGIWLLPLAIVLGVLAVSELITMYRKRGHQPQPLVLCGGVLITILAAGMPVLAPAWTSGNVVPGIGWLVLGLAAALFVAIIAELRRFEQPGTATTNLALTTFAIVYVGGLIGFMVQLRMLSGGPWGNDGRWGMLALVSLVATVKMSDIGQYTVGRLIGRHKLAPKISPGKTWEGAAGGVVFAAATSTLLVFWRPDIAQLQSGTNWESVRTAVLCRAMACGTLLAIAGMLGDLAESMLKRDAGIKDSSAWMPGFGGVLDLLDSLLVAAPVAYLFWAIRWMGP